ncbi:hypothetical protein [Nocardioides sp. cx-173]|uniref:hypothetical protein n=1 Tax=Nocardioides sp. cx-173 TaxID=2898796 RepID=UPI001E44575D|nr:hypothetical protein [Nocardioides sp. cx-173]MCD4525981.1 hypothetical protein [Nocardioides sp. cx-173]UGB43678.1 hypothetical protein LQ940_09170 [Nocardioides sp. cx-173]
MISLHDRLADLAEDGPDGPPTSDVWERGRRYGRRRRVEAAALVLVLLAAGGSLLGALLPAMSYDVGPADADAALRLPDRLYAPSPWLRGTDDVGQIGPLVAVVEAERKSWTGSRTALAGVSSGGEYAFLDLPGLPGTRGQDVGTEIALSDDGRLLAYPLTGTPEGEPNLMDGAALVGVAVYDTVSGEVTRHRVRTEHGIGVAGLAWVEGTLWMNYGQWDQGADESTDSGSGSDYRVYAWEPGREPRRIAGPLANRMPEVSGPGLVTVSARRMSVFDHGGSRLRDLRLNLASETSPVLNASGTRVALLEDPDGDPSVRTDDASSLRSGVVPAGTDIEVMTERVGDVTADELWGWRDDWHVLVRDYGRNALLSVDVNTGAEERLVLMSEGASPVLARDALAAPVFDAPEPPYVMDLRLRASLVVLAALLGLGGLVLWRRRGRA